MNTDASSVCEFSLWLLPCADQARVLDSFIMNAAAVFGTAAFPAHVTVQGDLGVSRGQALEAAAALAGRFASIEWTVLALAGSEQYFRSCYLALQACDNFTAMQTESCRLCGQSDGLAPFPHLSLGYGEPADPLVKPALLRRHVAFMQAGGLHTDRLALARSSKDVPIAEWEVLDTFPLCGG